MPQPALKIVPQTFPFRGLHESAALADQPESTSPAAQNVRGYDPIDLKDRGGQRGGLAKWFPTAQVAAPVDVMALGFLATADTQTWADPWDTQTASTYTLALPVSGLYADCADPVYTYYRYQIAAGGVAKNQTGGNNKTLGLKSLNADAVRFQVTLKNALTGAGGFPGLVIALGDRLLSPCVRARELQFFFTGTSLTSVSGASFDAHGTGGATLGPITWTTGQTISLVAIFEPSKVTLSVDGTPHVWNMPAGSGPWSNFVGAEGAIRVRTDANGANGFIEMSDASAARTSVNYDNLGRRLIYGQAGELYFGYNTTGFARVDSTAFTATTSYHTTASEISITPAGANFYLADGTNPLRRISISTGAMSEPAATGGSLPANTRLLWLFQDRLFHGRFAADPYNYIASKAGDYLNYDFSDLTQKGAFAGTNVLQAGLLAGVLTAAIPYGDVSCVLGMAKQIGVMRGNPKAGGSIDMVSREVGIVGPRAWARDPDGTLYFMAADGLYRMAPNGGIPQPMSRGRLDETLGTIDHSSVRVVMAWDPRELGVKIYLVPSTSDQPSTAVFWEQRKNAFWVDNYPMDIGPTACVGLSGSSLADRLALLGSWDGYLRFLDPSALSDDGEAIASYVDYPPFQPQGAFANSKIVGSRFVFTDNGSSFGATYALRLGTDPLTAFGAAQAYSRTLTLGGYQSLDRTRTRGSCAILRVSNEELNRRWAIESANFILAPSGRLRA